MATLDRLVPAGDARLRPRKGGSAARALLEAFEPPDGLRSQGRERALALIDAEPLAFSRSAASAHFTASAVILDESLRYTLLVFHPRYTRWQQPGGHADGDANLLGVALREAEEETGLAGLRAWPEIVDVAYGRGEAPPPHAHVDVRFLVLSPSAVLPESPEGLELRWFTHEEVESELDDERRLMVAAAFPLARRLRERGLC